MLFVYIQMNIDDDINISNYGVEAQMGTNIHLDYEPARGAGMSWDETGGQAAA